MTAADLLPRLQAAEGPDRALDAEIALQSGWTYLKMKGDAYPYWRKPDEARYFMREMNGPPRFTASIDAVLSLMPEGFYWLLAAGRVREREPLYGAQVLRAVPPHDVAGEGECDSAPAIALLIAILKARQP